MKKHLALSMLVAGLAVGSAVFSSAATLDTTSLMDAVVPMDAPAPVAVAVPIAAAAPMGVFVDNNKNVAFAVTINVWQDANSKVPAANCYVHVEFNGVDAMGFTDNKGLIVFNNFPPPTNDTDLKAEAFLGAMSGSVTYTIKKTNQLGLSFGMRVK